ncbi:hypothetical protein AB0J82_11135 [Asanoa sp. NPDC049518]|uniref:hypothetical protein n=1 Tax=unclassified Asanoa TaxID=2685164 RepID=UPI00342F65BD
MTVDERVHAALVDLADEVRPAPDPYGRLRARRSRVRKRRAVSAGAAFALIAVVATTLPLLPDRGGSTITDQTTVQGINEWGDRLRLSPVRGAFGEANPAYVDEVARLALEQQRAGAYRMNAPVTEVNVIYLDDVDRARVAFVAFHLATPDPVRQWTNASGWFTAPPGASAAELVSASTAALGDGLDPFSELTNFGGQDSNAVADVALAVAPAECVVESAPLPALDVWTPEPTGSYVLRTRDTERSEWWRVVCAGVVKEAGPARPIPGEEPLTDDQVDAALRGARGPVDETAARDALHSATWEGRNLATGPARVVWGGEITGAQPDNSVSFDGRAVMTVAPWIRDRWSLAVDIRYAAEQPNGSIGTGVRRMLPADPKDPDAALPVRLGESVSVLVVVPDGATRVRAIRAGAVIDTADVSGQAAVVDAPDAPDLTFEALDRNGSVLTTATMPPEPPLGIDLEVNTW